MATSQGANSYRNARTSLKPHVKSKPSQQRRNSTGSVNGKEHAAAGKLFHHLSLSLFEIFVSYFPFSDYLYAFRWSIIISHALVSWLFDKFEFLVRN